MSKSRGNVVNPDEYVNELGVDTVRTYLMFLAPWEQGGEWDDSGISGMSRWMNRVWNLVLEPYGLSAESSLDENACRDLKRFTHQTIKKVTQQMERFRFNTMVASLMEFTNYLTKVKENGQVAESDWKESLDTLLLLLAPAAPHLTEELWQQTGHEYSVHNQSWPQWDEELAKEDEITLIVQVNGKLRDRITVGASIAEDEAKQVAFERERVKTYLADKQVVNTVYVPGKLVNIVVR